ncbi:DNA primase [Rothia sp. P6271]|uniref:DNA primase n=1 Tax=Rothia sp. P6271 TaxID=3402659 RepID=UPI003ABE396A
MAGLIRREDIDEVRSRTDIREIIEGYVRLKSAGIGSFKGLCPFHDERTPSFHVRPQMGTYHCFGCGESGDVIAFLMQVEHTSFTETVEKLAARINYELHYEQGSGLSREEVGRRQRLLDAHKIAAEFFQKNLYMPSAVEAQRFLGGRGFDAKSTAQFGVGFAPQGWNNLLNFLRKQGFSDEELEATGMFSRGQRGLYDRFRGRIMWPIRGIAGETIGFGARRLFDDDKGPKYLNTPETVLYKKSQVLYGLDLAKRHIAKRRQVVVVEGYTDVMAAHLAGVDTAVATCGTAFGVDHIRILRRILGDDGSGGEVIFTFDGDAAGQKAALSAFEEDQRFMARTFVAVAQEDMDPCELRIRRGNHAVRSLIEHKQPLFEFALRSTIRKFDMDSLEGRVQAMRAVAPILAGIKDSALKPAYIREVSGWLGLGADEVQRAVVLAAQQVSAESSSLQQIDHTGGPDSSGEVVVQSAAVPFEVPDSHDPLARLERTALEVLVQVPQEVPVDFWQQLVQVQYRYRLHTVLAQGVMSAAAEVVPAAGHAWLNQVRSHIPEAAHTFLAELSVSPLPASSAEQLTRYTHDILRRLLEEDVNRQKSELMLHLQRLDARTEYEQFQQIQRRLMELESHRRKIRQGIENTL